MGLFHHTTFQGLNVGGKVIGHVKDAMIMHYARVLLFSYGKFTTNSNKNMQFGVFALWKTTK